MSNTARKDSFVPRTQLSRTLEYRPHVKWSYYLLVVTTALFTLGVAVFAMVASSKGQYNQAWSIVITLGFGPLILGLEARYLLKPIAFTKVIVEGDRLFLDGLKGQVEVPFSQVQSLQFSFAPFLGGWFKIYLKDGTSHKFSSALERSEYILEAMAAYQPELLNIKDFAAYRKTAIASDHSWARSHEQLQKKRLIGLKFLVLPVLAFFFVPRTWAHGFALLYLNCLLGYVVWTITETICFRHSNAILERNPQSAIRDASFDRRVIFVGNCAHVGLFALGFLLWMLLK